MLYCIGIQQLILNTDLCMIYMTFHVQLLKYFTNMGEPCGMWLDKIILHMAP